ncbi:GerAB/ArcD/ProY family transporter [Peribacillus aracenensis]|uniref:GerAB/ArcD/ProY family transporter n=1 Tax=Peribacillus aracenensis TaxID=2976708 RepID=UPI0021A73B54|nr:spore germination protein [Peribacillus sp. BBB004]
MNNKRISQSQLFFIVLQSQIGFGLISIPYIVFLKAKTDSWISVLIGGLIVQVVILIQWALCRRFPSNTIFEITNSLCGKIIGTFITISYSIYFILVCSTLLSFFSHTIKNWLLPFTPGWIVKLLIISIGIYVAREKLNVMARLFVLTTIVLFLFILLPIYSLKDGTTLYLLPIGKEGAFAILKGAKEAFLLMQGFEIFIIIFPFVNATSKSKLKIVSSASITVTILYTFLTLICLMFFSPKEFPLIPEPILYLIKSFGFSIIERPDVFFISFWIVLVSTTFMSFLYAASKGLSTLKFMNRKKFVYFCAIAIFIISIIPMNKKEIIWLSKIVANSGLIFNIVIPIILLFISIILRKQEAFTNK